MSIRLGGARFPWHCRPDGHGPAKAARTRRPSPVLALVVLAVLVAACAPSASGLTDPKEILGKAVTAVRGLKTVHVVADLAGQVKLSFGGSSAGAPLALDGTELLADLDLAGSKASVSISAPSLLNFKADLIAVDGVTYVRAPLLGASGWAKAPSGSGGNPLASFADPGMLVGVVTSLLDRPEVAARLLGTESCGDGSCYRVSLTIPAADSSGALGPLAGFVPGLAIGDIPVIAWIRTGDLRPTKLTMDLALGAAGSISATMQLSAFDAPITITAPTAMGPARAA